MHHLFRRCRSFQIENLKLLLVLDARNITLPFNVNLASQFGAPQVICQTLNVLGATYANCDGQYVITNDHVDWAPERPVYRHENKDRYIFWNAHGLGWSIGKKDYLTTGSHWHRSKSFQTEFKKPYKFLMSGFVAF